MTHSIKVVETSTYGQTTDNKIINNRNVVIHIIHPQTLFSKKKSNNNKKKTTLKEKQQTFSFVGFITDSFTVSPNSFVFFEATLAALAA